MSTINKTKIIYCRVERCLACRSCQIACAVEHSSTRKLVSAIQEHPVPKSRIKVLDLGAGDEMIRSRSLPLLCRQCLEPLCLEACIAGGITKEDETGLVQFDREKCVGCWSCIMLCPYGAVVQLNELKKAVKCDLCPDREIPACVEACPTKALIWCRIDELPEIYKNPLPVIMSDDNE